MIFNLFKNKKKWQHKDKNIRIEAVNELLQQDEPSQHEVLMGLLASDESELVRKAVLIKLNNLDAYINASIDNDKESIRKFAKNKTQLMLADGNEGLVGLEVKKDLLTTDRITELSTLEYWLTHETNDNLICILFDKVAVKKTNQSYLMHVFANKQSEQVQRYILASVTDTNLLNKLSKKAVNDNIKQLIVAKVEANKVALEKPIVLEKQIQLLLSKLLALKEVNDYGEYINKHKQLGTSWTNYLPDFSCLPLNKQTAFVDKYAAINEQLDKVFAPKSEAYNTELKEKIALEQQAKNQKALEQQLSGVKQQLALVMLNSSDDQLDNISKEVEAFKGQVSASELSNAFQEKLHNELSQISISILNAPLVSIAINDADVFIETISALPLPESIDDCEAAQTQLKNWQQTFKTFEKSALGQLPRLTKTKFEQFINTWQQVLNPLQQQQKQNLQHIKTKLQDIKRLLQNGKFKVCFGLFNGVKTEINTLTSYQMQQVQRDFDMVSEKMAELSDWEQYIATPKKQKLLESIQILVETPLDNPNEQASQVKALRKQWNLLGHAEPSVDKSFNEQFDIACEAAFAPCRLFYAEQDKVRANNAVVRTEIINEMQKLAEPFIKSHNTIEQSEASVSNDINVSNSQDLALSNVDFKSLDHKTNQLFKKWQEAGEVDKAQYKNLLESFKHSQKIVKNEIHSHYQRNSELKQQLIDSAKQLLQGEDIFKAIDGSKKLQQNWRNVGYAGATNESKLWQAFRAVNDEIFSKRDEVITKQQEELEVRAEQFIASFEAIKSALENNTDNASYANNIKQSILELDNLLAQVYATKPLLKHVSNDIEQYIKVLKQKNDQLIVKQKQLSWQYIFTTLSGLAQGDMTPNFDDNETFNVLSSVWKKRLTTQLNNSRETSAEERLDKTLALEILANVESPTQDAAKRMAVQVSLMQNQMVSGVKVDLESELVDWMKLGKLQESDLPLLARLQPIFLS